MASYDCVTDNTFNNVNARDYNVLNITPSKNSHLTSKQYVDRVNIEYIKLTKPRICKIIIKKIKIQYNINKIKIFRIIIYIISYKVILQDHH